MEGTATISIEDLLYYKEIEKTLKSNENFTYIINDETGKIQRFSIITKSKLAQAHIKTNKELINKLNSTVASTLQLLDNVEEGVKQLELLHENQIEERDNIIKEKDEFIESLRNSIRSKEIENKFYWEQLKEKNLMLSKLRSRGLWARIWNL